jgi:predicted thioesterase
MLSKFNIGDIKQFQHCVEQADTATFEAGTVHPVYSTFALARDAEWCCRLFVLDMKEENEEGIGTFIDVLHQSPALLNSVVTFEAQILSIEKNSIICSFIAKVGERVIASGKQGQKILLKEKLKTIFESLN